MSLANRGAPLIQWGVSTITLAGHQVCGDQHMVKLFGDQALVAVVDGLGHGDEAAAAASAAIATLERFASEPVISLVRRCHQQLRKTRGAVMSLASFNGRDNRMTWLGVGNVEGVLLRQDQAANPAREAVLMRGGIVGYLLPPLKALTTPVSPGDTLLLATDGIREGFAEDLSLAGTPQETADRICLSYCKGTDDALVVVVRYLGRKT